MKTFAPLVVLASFVSIAAAVPVGDYAIAKRSTAGKWISLPLYSGSKREEEPEEDVDGDNNKSGELYPYTLEPVIALNSMYCQRTTPTSVKNSPKMSTEITTRAVRA